MALGPGVCFQTAKGLHRALVLRGENAPWRALSPTTLDGEQFERDWALPSSAGEEVEAAFIWEESGVSS